MQHAIDPLDQLASLGVRMVWLEDFNEELVLVDDCKIALIDIRVPRFEAAKALRDLLGVSCGCLGSCGLA